MCFLIRATAFILRCSLNVAVTCFLAIYCKCRSWNLQRPTDISRVLIIWLVNILEKFELEELLGKAQSFIASDKALALLPST